MKRVAALLILLSMVLAPFAAAAKVEPVEKTPEELKIMQDAIVEMAQSWLRRSRDIRYDWESLTVQERRTAGISRVTTGDPVGAAAPDNLMYTNCAQFTYTVYNEVFGRGPNATNGRTNQIRTFHNVLTATHPEVVLRFGSGGMTDRDAFVAQMKELLQPGDIINVLKIHGSGNGHSMLYVGDFKGDGTNYIIHSGGNPEGTLGDSNIHDVRVDGPSYYLGSGAWGAANPDADSILIIRPLNTISIDEMKPEAKARLQYPGLDLIRTTDVWQYLDVAEGQEITVDLELKNSSSQTHKGLVVTDPAPQGAQVIESSVNGNGTVKDGGVSWTLDLAAGETVHMTYKIKVTAKAGEKVLLPENNVSDIRGREITWYVGGEPIPTAPLEALAKDPRVEGLTEGTNTMELELANRIYSQVLGMDLGLPQTMKELIDGLFDEGKQMKNTVDKIWMLQPKDRDTMTEDMQKIYDMIIPNHLTGQVVHLGYREDSMYAHHRVLTYFPQGYRPGDVFLIWNGPDGETRRVDPQEVQVGIYLGDKSVLVAKDDGTGLMLKTFRSVVEDTLAANIMITLRPSCSFPDNLTHLYPDPEPEAPAQPENIEVPTEPETPQVPQAPAEEQGAPLGIIAGAAAGAVVIIAAAAVLIKKKKK